MTYINLIQNYGFYVSFASVPANLLYVTRNEIREAFRFDWKYVKHPTGGLVEDNNSVIVGHWNGGGYNASKENVFIKVPKRDIHQMK